MKARPKVSIPKLVKGVQSIAVAVQTNAETLTKLVALIGALDLRIGKLEGTDDGDIHTDEQDSGVSDADTECAVDPASSED